MGVEKVRPLMAVERKILWLSARMIHNANHFRAKSEVTVAVIRLFARHGGQKGSASKSLNLCDLA